MLENVHLVDEVSPESEERRSVRLVHVEEWAKVRFHKLMGLLTGLLKSRLLEFK